MKITTVEEVEQALEGYLARDLPETTIVGVAGSVRGCPVSCALQNATGIRWSTYYDESHNWPESLTDFVSIRPSNRLKTFINAVDDTESENSIITLARAQECWKLAQEKTEQE